MRLLIKNGHLVDPSTNLDCISNLYVEDGKIVSITNDVLDADEVIDASGLIVSPGFIDIHMHEDKYLEDKDRLDDSMSTSALAMGVTLDVGGNCGENSCNPLKYFELIDRDGGPTNIALFIGHSYLRDTYLKHNKYKPISDDDISLMCDKAKEYLSKGCLGVSFGVKYVPSADYRELLSLAKTCTKEDRLVSSHVRQDEDEVFAACEELANLAKDAKIRVEFSHIGSMGGYGQMSQLLSQIDDYRKQGIDISADCYPYDAFCTSIGSTTYDDGFLDRYHSDYSHVLIASGKYKGQFATKQIFDEVRNNDPEAKAIGFFMKKEDVDMAYSKDYVMVGSDGTRTNGSGHPRASGSFARFIEDYIATNKISLSEGINKMSCLAAKQLKLRNKGTLRIGADADITIFDLSNVKDNATYIEDLLTPSGIEYVIINGEIALKHGEIINNHLGKSVRIY